MTARKWVSLVHRMTHTLCFITSVVHFDSSSPNERTEEMNVSEAPLDAPTNVCFLFL